ncbi:alpha/beta fold hydrolase [Streptomyces mirabilis]|uniref:alpha/beta fold hydrolase n=1 Tax=Streptomyces mirabilis TaxID=68239 RepID=UPI0037BCD0C9
MAYVDEGQGDPIVFQHGNPTSSYLWRDVMPHLRGMGRLIACDLVGMGNSDKLTDSGPNGYTREHQEYLSALWEHLGVIDNVVLVLHNRGSALDFDWACRNRERVAGIAYWRPSSPRWPGTTGAATTKWCSRRSARTAARAWSWTTTSSSNSYCRALPPGSSARRRCGSTAAPAKAAGPR